MSGAERVVGALTSAARGDAFGAGCRGGVAAPTDATQQQLFVLEGLLRARGRQLASGRPVDAAAMVHAGLLRWLSTQEASAPPPVPDGWLVGVSALYSRRAEAPDTARSLRTGLRGSVAAPVNNRSEATVLVRALPAAVASLAPWTLGGELAALTHGDAGALAATGFLAVLLRGLLVGLQPADAVAAAAGVARERGHGARAATWERAAHGDPPVPEARSAEAVLAAALWAWQQPEPLLAVAARVAAPSRGGSVVGALVGAAGGALHGPEHPLDAVVGEVAGDAARLFDGPFDVFPPNDWQRYPG